MSLCGLCRFSVFLLLLLFCFVFVKRLFLIWMTAASSLSVCWPLSSWEGFDSCCGDQYLPWILSRGCPLLCGCQWPVRGRVCSLVGGVEAPDLFLSCVSDLQWEVSGIRAHHWERSHWVFFLWRCSLVNMLRCVPFHPLCRLTKYTVLALLLVSP